MLFSGFLQHPAIRGARIVLSLGFTGYILWLVWTDGRAGYVTWVAMFTIQGLNFVAERAKRPVV
jgi:hypothetical protein